ncbi:hypothetical protein AVEN_105843-1 [Araneus ventricosus]|uniref:Uncharacterized protein n=1 Tax=Araneus ventricosus TaxID=182803 RepID=A0A4Y2TGX2_ARAVE|nr:hypothetical protein AVEN_105843-1 [Araneus ventricosus]
MLNEEDFETRFMKQKEKAKQPEIGYGGTCFLMEEAKEMKSNQVKAGFSPENARKQEARFHGMEKDRNELDKVIRLNEF